MTTHAIGMVTGVPAVDTERAGTVIVEHARAHIRPVRDVAHAVPGGSLDPAAVPLPRPRAG